MQPTAHFLLLIGVELVALVHRGEGQQQLDSLVDHPLAVVQVVEVGAQLLLEAIIAPAGPVET